MLRCEDVSDAVIAVSYPGQAFCGDIYEFV